MNIYLSIQIGVKSILSICRNLFIEPEVLECGFIGKYISGLS